MTWLKSLALAAWTHAKPLVVYPAIVAGSAFLAELAKALGSIDFVFAAPLASMLTIAATLLVTKRS